MKNRLIYLDNNATTPTDPRVVDAMLPYFYEHPGNAASRNHPFGWAAEEAVDYAREQIANLISVDSKEIIFKGFSILDVLIAVSMNRKTRCYSEFTCL